jgi:hypothetical protein
MSLLFYSRTIFGPAVAVGCLLLVGQVATAQPTRILTRPGDPIELVNGTNDDDANAGPPPMNETVDHTIDGVGQKYLNVDPFGVKKGRLREMPRPAVDLLMRADSMPAVTLISNSRRESRYAPYGNNLPTAVSLPNDRLEQCVIETVRFVLKERFPTPKRQNLYGAAEALPVSFRARHYQRKQKRFALKYQIPPATEGGDAVSLQVAIVEPKWVGNSYVGTLTVEYNGDQQISIEDVEVEVLAKVPSLKNDSR